VLGGRVSRKGGGDGRNVRFGGGRLCEDTCFFQGDFLQAGLIGKEKKGGGEKKTHLALKRDWFFCRERDAVRKKGFGCPMDC